MDWDDVRVFEAVASARSLSAGARGAGVDRSTASRRIAGLERALGARLFLRTRSGLRLSPAGERLLVHAGRMGEQARALQAAASEAGATATGKVRIATTEALATTLVRSGLLELRARHPGLELELLGGNRVLDLARGEADLALRVTRVSEPSLRVRKVARLPFALFAAERYLARRGRPKSERELAGHEVLAHGGELASLPEARWLTGRAGVQVVLRSSSLVALMAAAIEGAGLVVLAGALGERDYGLVRLFDIESLTPRPLWLAMHPDAAARSAVRIVADRIARIVGEGSLPARAGLPRSGVRATSRG
jgi:DNA-binding transcriptional LysR family regulator